MRVGRISLPRILKIGRCRFAGGGDAARPEPFGRASNSTGDRTMDIVVLAIGAVFFALAFAYVAACDRL